MKRYTAKRSKLAALSRALAPRLPASCLALFPEPGAAEPGVALGFGTAEPDGKASSGHHAGPGAPVSGSLAKTMSNPVHGGPNGRHTGVSHTAPAHCREASCCP